MVCCRPVYIAITTGATPQYFRTVKRETRLNASLLFGNPCACMRACVRARPPSSSSSSSSSSPLVFSFSSSLYPRFSLFFGIPFTTSSRPSSSPTDPTQPLRSSCSLNSSFETLPHQLAIYSRYLYVGIYEQIIIGGMFRHFSAKLLLFILRYPADRDRTVSAGIN